MKTLTGRIAALLAGIKTSYDRKRRINGTIYIVKNLEGKGDLVGASQVISAHVMQYPEDNSEFMQLTAQNITKQALSIMKDKLVWCNEVRPY